MKMNSILKNFLIKYSPTIIFFIVKNYFGLDFLNDFNPFTSETKQYFNGNNSQGSSINPPSEGEGSNRQNNPQGSNINLPSFKEVAEQAGLDSSINPPSEGEGSNSETRIPISSILNLPSEGEGSNIQNNPQDDSINPEEVKEVEGGVIVSGETLEQIKALYRENFESFEKIETVFDKSVRQDISEKSRQMEEIYRILAERKAEMEQRIRDFYDLKNQGQSEESLSDIERQLVEDTKALHEDSINLVNRVQNNTEAGTKLFLQLLSKHVEKIKDIVNESNSK